MMARRIAAAAAGMGLGVAAAVGAEAAAPAYSGLVPLEAGVWLASGDGKADREGDTGERLFVVTPQSAGGYATRPLVCDWSRLGGVLPYDAESLTAVPDGPGDFLLVESGYEGSAYGRIIRLSVSKEGDVYRAKAVHVQQLPKQIPGGPAFDNVEGAVLLANGPDLWLVLGKRGKDDKAAWLVAGRYDAEAPDFAIAASMSFHTAFKDSDAAGSKRYCSDLLAVGNTLFAPSCNDGKDGLKFESAIFRIARVRFGSGGAVAFEPAPEPVCQVPGHKVEAIALTGKPGELLCAADNESNGGALILRDGLTLNP